MKLGMPVLYEFDNIDDNFKLAKSLGLDFIELNLNFDYVRKAIENHYIEDILKYCKMDLILHFFDEADFGSYPEVVDGYYKLFKRYIKLGHKYIKKINIHNNLGPVVTISGVKNYIYSKEFDSYINRLMTELNKLRKLCDRYDIELVIENIDTITAKADFIKDVYLKEKEQGYHFTYDIGHDNLSNYFLKDFFNDNHFKFSEFHFHDANGRNCHLALGEGNSDLKYFKNLAVSNDAYVLLEVKSKVDLIKSVEHFKKM